MGKTVKYFEPWKWSNLGELKRYSTENCEIIYSIDIVEYNKKIGEQTHYRFKNLVDVVLSVDGDGTLAVMVVSKNSMLGRSRLNKIEEILSDETSNTTN